jgi:hypothetical protein
MNVIAIVVVLLIASMFFTGQSREALRALHGRRHCASIKRLTEIG